MPPTKARTGRPCQRRLGRLGADRFQVDRRLVAGAAAAHHRVGALSHGAAQVLDRTEQGQPGRSLLAHPPATAVDDRRCRFEVVLPELAGTGATLKVAEAWSRLTSPGEMPSIGRPAKDRGREQDH
jgi:hypothetical protein